MSCFATRLIEMVRDARVRTIELVTDLSDEQLMGPRLKIVNPLLWEIGHIAWFQEKWVLRHLFAEAPGCPGADLLYDSAAIAHDTRWDLQLLSRTRTLDYLAQVRDRVIDRIEQAQTLEQPEQGSNRNMLNYFVQLSVFHEDMHTEAFTYTRQTLAYGPPHFNDRCVAGMDSVGALPGDVEIPGTHFWLGSSPSEPFVFDNEKW